MMAWVRVRLAKILNRSVKLGGVRSYPPQSPTQNCVNCGNVQSRGLPDPQVNFCRKCDAAIPTDAMIAAGHIPSVAILFSHQKHVHPYDPFKQVCPYCSFVQTRVNQDPWLNVCGNCHSSMPTQLMIESWTDEELRAWPGRRRSREEIARDAAKKRLTSDEIWRAIAKAQSGGGEPKGVNG